jgi:hypothetical protein
MITKVAIPLNNNILAETFRAHEVCRVYEIEDDKLINEQTFNVRFNGLQELLDLFVENNITDIIVHKILEEDVKKIIHSKVNLFLGVGQAATDVIIQKYLTHSLKTDVKYIVN